MRRLIVEPSCRRVNSTPGAARHFPSRCLVWVAVASLLCPGCGGWKQRYFSELREEQEEALQILQGRQGRPPCLEGALTLEQALRCALEHNPRLRAVLQEKVKARGRRVQAYAELLPKAQAVTSVTRLEDPPPGAGEALGQLMRSLGLQATAGDEGTRDYSQFQLRVQQPLFQGGRIFIAQRASRLYTYLTDETVRATVQEVIYEAAARYYQVQLARKLLAVQETALEAAEKHLVNVQTLKKFGKATAYSVLRARVDVSNIEASLIEQRNALQDALAGLYNALGASQASRIEPSSPMRFVPLEISFEEAARVAFQHRPDLYQAALQADLQGQSVRAVLSRYLPSIEAFFDKTWARPDARTGESTEWGNQWQAGVTLTWPLFDGLNREGTLIEEQAKRAQTEELLDLAQQRALLEVRIALNNLQNARHMVESQELNQDRAKEALRLVQAGRKEGTNSDVEVLDAIAALTQAQGTYHRALYRHVMARLQLLRSLGGLAPGPGRVDVPSDGPDLDADTPFARIATIPSVPPEEAGDGAADRSPPAVE